MEIINDYQTSVRKSLKEIDPDYLKYEGLVICGTHSPDNTEDMIDKIGQARETGRPFLGICFGHQLAAIEYARNVLHIQDATSEEFSDTGTFVIKKRPEGLKVGLHEGESWWSNYDVAINTNHPNHFFTVPYHPEYQSSKEKPHLILSLFLSLCKRHFADTRPL